MRREAGVTSRGPLARVEGFRGKVHAVFPTAVYVDAVDGPMLVVHDATHGHTPTSLLVEAARPVDWGVRPGDPVAGRLGRLGLGTVVLDARHARVWQPPEPRPGAVDASLVASLCDAAGDATDRLRGACEDLADAVRLQSARRIASALRALVGAGPGLTPSGDDAIVGLLAALHRADASPGDLDLVRSLVPPLLGRTTTISAHYVRLALDGHVGEHLTNLVDACCLGGALDRALAARVLGTGATSGADALVGVAVGLSLLADHQPGHELKDVA